jgi:hypothetical protein
LAPVRATYNVETQYGIVEEVPITTWRELEHFHYGIVKAVFEVLIEKCFHPGSMKKTNKDGFIAPLHYWRRYKNNPRKFPLKEPVRFLNELLKKDSFISSVGAFNAAASADWLTRTDYVKLGSFVYSVCFYLAPVLVEADSGRCAKPRITPFVS